MATTAYEEAVADIGQLDKSKTQEATTVLEFIRENIGLWKQAGGADDAAVGIGQQ